MRKLQAIYLLLIFGLFLAGCGSVEESTKPSTGKETAGQSVDKVAADAEGGMASTPVIGQWPKAVPLVEGEIYYGNKYLTSSPKIYTVAIKTKKTPQEIMDFYRPKLSGVIDTSAGEIKGCMGKIGTWEVWVSAGNYEGGLFSVTVDAKLN